MQDRPGQGNDISHFLSRVGSVFTVEGGRHIMRLTSVEPHSPGFTLLFTGPPGDVLPEGMHSLTAPDGARFTFYLMPVHTPARDRQDYQAVFN